MNKIYRILFQSLFCFPFILFLILAGSENFNQLNKILYIISISILLFLGVTKSKFHQLNFEKENFSVVPLVTLGTIFTYSLQYFLNFNAILSAGIIGLFGIIIQKTVSKNITVPIYCGAFVGMTNPNIQIPFITILSMGIIAGILFYFSKSFFIGIGGKLGTIAFASVIICIIFIKYIINAIII